MPESLHPPYGIGSVPPRQLNRWLDVNSQNGPLTRTRGYVSLPAFNIPSAGRTYSEIVGVYSYIATNNFSIKNYKNLSNDGSYSLCIAYADTDLTVHRFILIKGTHDNNLSFPPIYNGQLIKRKFRLEIWDGTGHANCANNSEIKINSSILGSLDYRYGTDFVLGTSSTLCPSQNLTNELQFYVTPPQANLVIWLENHIEQQYVLLSNGDKVDTWTDRSPNVVAFGSSIIIANKPSFFMDVVPGTKYDLEFIGQQYLLGNNINSNIQHLFILVTGNVVSANNHQLLYIIDNTGQKLILYGNDDALSGKFKVDFDGDIAEINNPPPINQVQLIEINIINKYVNVWDGSTGILKTSTVNTVGYTLETPCSVVLGDNIGPNDGKGTLIYGMVAYSLELSNTDRNLVIQYMLSLAAGMHSFIAPLTFAPCTVLTPN